MIGNLSNLDYPLLTSYYTAYCLLLIGGGPAGTIPL